LVKKYSCSNYTIKVNNNQISLANGFGLNRGIGTSKMNIVKKQNLENSYPRRKQTGHYGNFPFGSGFATCLEPTQQAAGYSASQNKISGQPMLAAA
jgi:hypothetical protein